jgi:hypothetical protein
MFNLKKKLNDLIDQATEADLEDNLSKRDQKLLRFLYGIYEWWDDLWDDRKNHFGNDGIDCRPERLVAA